MRNILTIDVEDWYQAIESIRFEDWPQFESRIVDSTHHLLRILGFYRVKATFFILGYVAERHPELVRDIFNDGHEIATHGYSHRLIYRMTPDEFAKELRCSISILESITGQKVLGHRAAAWSITADSLWALDIILGEGLSYDSSVSPWKSYLFGLPDSERLPHIIKRKEDKTLIEFPMTTLRIFKRNLPFAGGFFTRFLPYAITKFFMKKFNAAGQPVLIWLHPWDLDVHQPKLNLPLLLKRHYFNLKSQEGKLKNLLKDFRFTAIKDALGAYA